MALADSDSSNRSAAAPRATPRAHVLPSAAHLDLLDPHALLAPAPRAWLAQHAQLALNHLNTPGEVRLRLVNDREMTEAHLRHLGLDSTTDVLTFDLTDGQSAPVPDHAPGRPLDVDILACVDEAARQAAARSIPVERELLLYTIHAVLHCLGEDDHDDDDFARMHAREDRILSAIGVGPTFSSALGPITSTGEGAPC